MRPMQQHRPELLGRRSVEIRFVFRGLNRQVQNTTRTVSSSDSGEVAMSRKKCNNRKKWKRLCMKNLSLRFLTFAPRV